MKVTAVILTRNEENNIQKCIKSLAWVDEVVVIDDYSHDNTAKVAEQCGAKIYLRKLNSNFAAARNYGQGKSSNEWVLFIDADEIVINEIENEIAKLESADMFAYAIKRIDHLWGKELKHGDVANTWIVRLIKKDTGKWERYVHEVWMSKDSSKTSRLRGVINHYPHQTINEFVESIRSYSLLHTKVLKEQGVKASIWQVVFYPVGKFVSNYFIKLGLLDGTAGFVHAMMMSFHSFIARSELLVQQNEAS